MYFFRQFAILISTALFLLACSNPPEFKGKPIQGNPTAPEFTLTDQYGHTRTLSEFKGKVVTLFFGFTHCPDVCPTHLARQAEVLKQLGPLANQVAVLFVTLDPERDTTNALMNYMNAFNPTFVALTGSPEETSKVAKAYNIFWQKTPLPDSALVYTIDHSTNSFVIDQTGRLRLNIPHEMSAADLTHDLKLLIDTK